jgi:geranyl-CoA carboxylase alpha subunit
MSFRSILVANRGEIALRVIRTAKALGYRSIAVYSEADSAAPHVKAADGAALIGAPPVGESYLSVDRILAAAKQTSAEAIHPGYGFLSENADFARACEAAGLTFIGPTAEAIDVMGNKAEAKRRMIEAGVPCVPGYEGEDQSETVFQKAAEEIGFPVMVKASAGGGGRGMRLVADPAELPAALKLARSEAENAFGSGELILEKAITRPRHVEIQVVADTHGNVIHLGERDCSVQRRHQKVIEEAPCPVMTPDLRAKMGEAAVEAARSIAYRGAGTVEFLLDESGKFYFLEMNTRLQVEHPVTELITGLDLVALQIAVARGETLGLSQAEVPLKGHAIEVRLYAEDPAQDFLPSTGKIDLWRPPTGEGIRTDAGIETGLEISPFYDPMLAKIIAWGETREIARGRLLKALENTALFGPRSNRDFLIAALGRDSFARGEATTAFIPEEFSEADLKDTQPTLEQAATAAVLHFVEGQERASALSLSAPEELRNWRSSGALVSRYHYDVADTDIDLTVSPQSRSEYVVRQGDEQIDIKVLNQDSILTEVLVGDSKRQVLSCIPAPRQIYLSMDGRAFSFRNRVGLVAGMDDAGGSGTVVAPMPGKLLEVFVNEGDSVTKGDRLAVLEAMKMQHEITASVDGVVSEVVRKPGDQVAGDDRLIEIEVAED